MRDKLGKDVRGKEREAQRELIRLKGLRVVGERLERMLIKIILFKFIT